MRDQQINILNHYAREASMPALNSNASDDEIKSLFRKLSITFNPDNNPGCADKFKEINQAYDGFCRNLG